MFVLIIAKLVLQQMSSHGNNAAEMKPMPQYHIHSFSFYTNKLIRTRDSFLIKI